MNEQDLAHISKVHKVDDKKATLRTSIPVELAKEAGIEGGDSLIWTAATVQGKSGLFARKVE
jgi:hypothetical protein